jgi:hypothetical protein
MRIRLNHRRRRDIQRKLKAVEILGGTVLRGGITGDVLREGAPIGGGLVHAVAAGSTVTAQGRGGRPISVPTRCIHTQWFVKVMNDAQRQDIFASARGCASSLGSSQSLGTWKMANNARTDSAGAEWWPKLMQIRATLIAEIDAAD